MSNIKLSKRIIDEAKERIKSDEDIIKEKDGLIKQYDAQILKNVGDENLVRIFNDRIEKLTKENVEAEKRIQAEKNNLAEYERTGSLNDDERYNTNPKKTSKGTRISLVALVALLLIGVYFKDDINNFVFYGLNGTPASTAPLNPEDDFATPTATPVATSEAVATETHDSQNKPANLLMVEYLEYQKSELEKELLNADKVDPYMTRVVNQNYIDYTNEMIRVYKEIPVLDDITNNEQVTARATYIYNNYVLPMMKAKGLTPNVNSNDDAERIASIENIANMIRISYPSAPVDASGRKYFKKSEDTDTYTQITNDKITLLDWVPFDERSAVMYFIPESLVQLDYSDSSRFNYLADIEYYNVTANMNDTNSEDFFQASRNVGIFLRDTIVLVGMNGGPSIYNVKDAQDSAYSAAMMRFTGLNIEGHLNRKKASCIYLCLDYETNEWVLTPVVEVYRDAKTGTFTDPTASMVGEEPKLVPFGNYAFENARKAVEEDYNNYLNETGFAYTYRG